MGRDSYIPISRFKQNPDNPRTIKKDQLEKLKRSIKSFPEMMEKRPMVCVTDEDGKLYPLGGNMRLRAIKEMGFKEVPKTWVALADEWTEEQRREFIVKDNANLGTWDFDALVEGWNIDDLEEWGVDLEWNKVEKLKAEEDDFDTTPPEEPKTVLGDLYEIGEHRLLCGDSTDSEQVAKLMNGEKADMVHTDPPYGVSYEGGHNKKKRKGIENDTLQGSDLTDLFYDSLLNAELFSKDTAAFYIWYASGKSVETYASFKNLNLNLRAVIQWYKVHSGLGAFMSQYIPNCEPCMYAHKKGHSPKWYGASDEKTVWELQRKGVSEFHPTQKPVELPARAIKNSSIIGNIVLDLFCGSGSTMVASHQLKRKCYGMELDPKYCDVIVNRMIKFDPDLRIKRNGIDVTDSFKLK